MGKTAGLVCAVALVIICIAYGDTGNDVCSSPPDVGGAVIPQFTVSEHPIGTAVIYNCPPGYSSLNVMNQISFCRINTENGKAEWTVPNITCSRNDVCSSPPDVGGAVIPQFTVSEHPIGTAVIYNCPPGYSSLNVMNQISFCRINTENGKAEWTVPNITCSHRESGSLSTTEPAPTSAGTETEPNVIVGGSSSLHTSQDKSNEDCFCTYEYEDQSVEAQTEQASEALKVGDTIKRGKRVSFKCRSTDMVLTWQNGLRLKDGVKMICNVCKKWQRNDVPICKKSNRSEAVISFYGHPHIFPGGIAIVEKGVENSFFCYNSWSYPEWDYGQRKAVSVIRNTEVRSFYVSLLVIQEEEDERSGKYECYLKDDSGQRLGSTFLHLQVKETNILCPPIDTSGDFTLQYSNHRRINSTVTFFCKDNGKRIEGYRSLNCLPNGTWSGRNPECIEVTCEEPLPPKHGSVRLHGDLKVGSLATYSCDPGRKLNGDPTTECLTSGQWMFHAPECLEVTCEEPLPPKHGSVRLHGDLKVGSLATYTCDPGRKLNGDPTTECLTSGQWKFDAPECLEITCEEPLPPKHGSVRLHCDLKVGSLATYSCDPGRKLNGDPTAECLTSGQWTFDAPECLGSCKVPFIENGELGTYEYSRTGSYFAFTKVPVRQDVESQKTLALHCKNGYKPVENPDVILSSNRVEVTCSDGSWSRDLQCKRTRCHEDPPPSKNARPVIRRRVHGYKIYYDCTSKYTIKISGNVTCHFGSWIGIAPRCLNQPCYTRNLDYPGLVKPPEEHFDSSESFEINCERGYRTTAGIRTISCVKGRWEISRNPCTSEREESRIIPPTRELQISRGGENQPGTNVESYSPRTTETTRNPECFCSYNYKDPHVKMQTIHKTLAERDVVKLGETVSLECDSPSHILKWYNGLIFYGKAYMTCSICRQWLIEDLPTCTRASNDISCPEFTLTPGLNVTYSKDSTVGSVASFQCSLPNKDLNGNSSSICQENGRWSNPLPSCEDQTCSIHDLGVYVTEGVELDMSTVTEEYAIIGFEVKLKCADRSVLTGDSKAVCEKQGKWKLGSFQCVPGCVLNLDTSSHLLVEPKKEGYRIGERITLSCPIGEELSSDVEQLMCLYGFWSDSLPICIELERKPSL